jgi:hypothetical protein
MKRLKKNQSGALGDLVASRNRFGEYDRKRVSPKHPGTASQLEAWGNMKYLSALWNGLREDQRVAWRRLKPKRYHVPLEGAKVFIRVWQQVNGWENQLGRFCGSAFVPLEGLGRAARTRHQ